MPKITTQIAFALLGICLGSNVAFAQGYPLLSGKDLNVETTQGGAQQAQRAKQPFAVSIMPVGRATVKIGSPLRFRMVALASGYGHLYVLSASGRSQVWFENVVIRAGRPIRYPQAGLVVRAAAPAGDETVIFVASRKPVDGFSGAGTQTAPIEVQASHDSFLDAIQKKFGEMPRENWAFANIKVRVRE